MPINIECGSCHSAFRVKETSAGKTGKCPRCRATVVVPAQESAASTADPADDDVYSLAGPSGKAQAVPVRKPAASEAGAGAGASPAGRGAAPNRPTRSAREILAGFRGEIQVVRPTLLYRLWILIVAGVMLLLPAIYVALIGLVGYVTYLHAVHNLWILRHLGSKKMAVLLYASPLVIGGVVVAFMLKPLFARPARRGKAKELDPSKEPLIFAFVDGVCQSVGSPRPARIEVDCLVNASARLDGGRLAWLTGELVLTIGLPLAAGLSLRSFAGVLAHEFGHFSQRVGLRLWVLITSINHWFARVVYERDEWDEMLLAWSSSDGDCNGGVILFGLLARLAVWLTRRVLWVLMMVGHVVSSFLSRQMEFDADRYAARMVGGNVFAETTRRLLELSLGDQGASYDLVQSWQERRLPDNLPKLVLANITQVPAEVLSKFHHEQAHARTGLFDTHPADKDRVARARREAGEPVFRLDGPATDLFRDFDGLARTVSLTHYRTLFGPQVTRDQLYPVAEALDGQEIAREGREAFQRFFLGALDPYQPVSLPSSYPGAPSDLKAAGKALVSARLAMLETRESSLQARAHWDDQQLTWVQAETAFVFLKVGERFNPADLQLEEASIEEAEEASQRAAAGRRAQAERSEPFVGAAGRRLTMLLAMLESDVVATRVPDGPARRDEARTLYPCAAHLASRIVPELAELMGFQQILGNLLRPLAEGKSRVAAARANACLRVGDRLHQALRDLQGRLGNGIEYPFEHAQEGIGLSRFALPIVPDARALGDLYQAADEAVQKITTLYLRVLGRLAVTAEEVERAIGLMPLEVTAPSESTATVAESERRR